MIVYCVPVCVCVCMAQQVMVTHGGNKQKRKRSVVREAKEVITSNKEGFRSAVVPLVPANTMVVMYMDKKYKKPFVIAKTLTATDPSKDGEHKINVQWWTAETELKDDAMCYQGPVGLHPADMSS